MSVSRATYMEWFPSFLQERVSLETALALVRIVLEKIWNQIWNQHDQNCQNPRVQPRSGLFASVRAFFIALILSPLKLRYFSLLKDDILTPRTLSMSYRVSKIIGKSLLVIFLHYICVFKKSVNFFPLMFIPPTLLQTFLLRTRTEECHRHY